MSLNSKSVKKINCDFFLLRLKSELKSACVCVCVCAALKLNMNMLKGIMADVISSSDHL